MAQPLVNHEADPARAETDDMTGGDQAGLATVDAHDFRQCPFRGIGGSRSRRMTDFGLLDWRENLLVAAHRRRCALLEFARLVRR